MYYLCARILLAVRFEKVEVVESAGLYNWKEERERGEGVLDSWSNDWSPEWIRTYFTMRVL